MKLSILAGIFISIGCIIYLTIGGVAGALLFSVGLLSVLHFNAALFTGKAGGLATSAITPIKLATIWCGNFIGCALVVAAIFFLPLGQTLALPATIIAVNRINNLWITNIILGIICGILMYSAVAQKGYVASMCVATFILAGTNHCVADMFYLILACAGDPIIIPAALFTLLCTTAGNIIGCNIIPLLTKEKAA